VHCREKEADKARAREAREGAEAVAAQQAALDSSAATSVSVSGEALGGGGGGGDGGSAIAAATTAESPELAASEVPSYVPLSLHLHADLVMAMGAGTDTNPGSDTDAAVQGEGRGEGEGSWVMPLDAEVVLQEVNLTQPSVPSVFRVQLSRKLELPFTRTTFRLPLSASETEALLAPPSTIEDAKDGAVEAAAAAVTVAPVYRYFWVRLLSSASITVQIRSPAPLLLGPAEEVWRQSIAAVLASTGIARG